MQTTFDQLYEFSRHDATKGLDLYEIIISRENLLLAYRNIKTNTGSKTKGCDGITIDSYKIKDEDEFINELINELSDYTPQMVRRVYIEKENGKMRPLGIPTMRDRLIQQAFKQVLEPICEAKFYDHSYGFRPNRQTHHALARCQYLINRSKMHHVVDIDIKGFFDNVNHAKLLSQLYTIGIKDKRVLSIINKMLKAPIEGEGIPTKGTPQGGILSPLLSNVVLNDLDWWISNQWENIRIRERITHRLNKEGAEIKDKFYNTLRKTNLKEMYIVRYADDFKIFTNSPVKAKKLYQAVKGYLKDHLNLEISPEKSNVVNLRKRASIYLGFKIKAKKKGKKYVAHTNISPKKVETITRVLIERIKQIQINPNNQNIMAYNAYVMGIKSYFRVATHVSLDLNEIDYRLSRTLYNRLKSIGKYGIPKSPNMAYKKFNSTKRKTFRINGMYLFPMAGMKTQNSKSFNRKICNYTEEGRSKKHTGLDRDVKAQLLKLMANPISTRTMEYNDNRLSKYSNQQGKCLITGILLMAKDVHCHHKRPKHLGGTDKFDNLMIIHCDVHRLIHATTDKTIERYLSLLQLNREQLKKVNEYRKRCNLTEIVNN